MDMAMTSLGMIGWWELTTILGVLALMMGMLVGVVFLAVWLSKRKVSSPVPPPAASTVRLATCPRCGLPLPADAPQGLCPRCVLQVGFETQDAAEPAFQDAAGRPNAPGPDDLAAHFPQLEIIELLGQGGMGAVYKARQKDLDRFVALKVLPGGAGRDPAFAERFTREARALAKLSHPNIVAVHDFGQIQRTGGSDAAGGKQEVLYYFVMEFIDGPNLRRLMQNQRLSPREAMTIVPQICEALQFAHDGGVVHRDIKPENILLDKKGRVKIADFGIAKIAGKRGDFSRTSYRSRSPRRHLFVGRGVLRNADRRAAAGQLRRAVLPRTRDAGGCPVGRGGVEGVGKGTGAPLSARQRGEDGCGNDCRRGTSVECREPEYGRPDKSAALGTDDRNSRQPPVPAGGGRCVLGAAFLHHHGPDALLRASGPGS